MRLAELVGLTSIQGSTSLPGKLIPAPSGGHAANGFVVETSTGGDAACGVAPATATTTRSATPTDANVQSVLRLLIEDPLILAPDLSTGLSLTPGLYARSYQEMQGIEQPHCAEAERACGSPEEFHAGNISRISPAPPNDRIVFVKTCFRNRLVERDGRLRHRPSSLDLATGSDRRVRNRCRPGILAPTRGRHRVGSSALDPSASRA